MRRRNRRKDRGVLYGKAQKGRHLRAWRANIPVQLRQGNDHQRDSGKRTSDNTFMVFTAASIILWPCNGHTEVQIIHGSQVRVQTKQRGDNGVHLWLSLCWRFCSQFNLWILRWTVQICKDSFKPLPAHRILQRIWRKKIRDIPFPVRQKGQWRSVPCGRLCGCPKIQYECHNIHIRQRILPELGRHNRRFGILQAAESGELWKNLDKFT